MPFLQGIGDAVMRGVAIKRYANHPRLSRRRDVHFIEKKIKEGVLLDIQDQFEETREGRRESIGEECARTKHVADFR